MTVSFSISIPISLDFLPNMRKCNKYRASVNIIAGRRYQWNVRVIHLGSPLYWLVEKRRCETKSYSHKCDVIFRNWKKVNWSLFRPGVAQRVGRGIALLFHDRGTRRGEWSAASPGRTLPPVKTRYPFYRRLGGPQGRSGRAENLVSTGIRSRTLQPVVSRYTDWATRPNLETECLH